MDTNASPQDPESAQFRRIAELLQEAHDQGQSFSDERRAELNELLRGNEENQAFAAQYLLDSQSIKELLAADEISALSKGSAPKHSTTAPIFFPRRLFSTLVTAASVAFAGLLAFAWMSRAPIAIIQDEADAIFADGAAPEEGELDSAAYSLVTGLISIEFRNGVTMTVTAPADFEVIDEYHVRLNKGSVRAMAPESGHGFIIETPDADIQDLGTEFGVSVDSDSGHSEVHVFDGRVDVKNRGERDAIASLELGDSARILKGKVDTNILAKPEHFLSPADVSHSRWQKTSEAIRQDENLVFYYGFNEIPGNDRLLKDEAFHGDSVDGVISGARWVSGRWPNKDALLFDEKGDSVAFDIPKELKQLTFAAWVKVDRFDEPLTAVMNSMAWKPGSMHLQISRSGDYMMPGIYKRIAREKSDATIPRGQWTLLVATVDTETSFSRSYVNGKLSINETLPPEATVDPGPFLLGSFRETIDGERIRGFRGRIDEVILWNRVLTDKEIRRLYFRGRPQARIDNDS